MNIKKTLKIGGAVLGTVVVVAYLVLGVVGIEPEFLEPSGEEFLSYRWTIFPPGRRLNWIARPGTRLKGEVVREAVKDWSFADERYRKGTGKDRRCQVEVRTPYFIRHSSTIGCGRFYNGYLYIHGHTDPSRMGIAFPHDKAWTHWAARDPRIRLKIDGKIYEFVAVTVTDRAESAAVFGWDPIRTQKGPDGKERVHEIDHLWRLYQMNVPDYSAPYQGPQHVAQNQ